MLSGMLEDILPTLFSRMSEDSYPISPTLHVI
jgi:hypothetical protein